MFLQAKMRRWRKDTEGLENTRRQKISGKNNPV